MALPANVMKNLNTLKEFILAKKKELERGDMWNVTTTTFHDILFRMNGLFSDRELDKVPWLSNLISDLTVDIESLIESIKHKPYSPDYEGRTWHIIDDDSDYSDIIRSTGEWAKWIDAFIEEENKTGKSAGNNRAKSNNSNAAYMQAIRDELAVETEDIMDNDGSGFMATFGDSTVGAGEVFVSLESLLSEGQDTPQSMYGTVEAVSSSYGYHSVDMRNVNTGTTWGYFLAGLSSVEHTGTSLYIIIDGVQYIDINKVDKDKQDKVINARKVEVGFNATPYGTKKFGGSPSTVTKLIEDLGRDCVDYAKGQLKAIERMVKG